MNDILIWINNPITPKRRKWIALRTVTTATEGSWIEMRWKDDSFFNPNDYRLSSRAWLRVPKQREQPAGLGTAELAAFRAICTAHPTWFA